VGGGLYAARSMAAPFALVEVGYPQVPVYRNNVLAGVTDKNGRLLVPMLAPYQVNTISIDPSSLPFGVTVETDKAFVPLPNTGRVVKFATLSLGAVTFHIVFTNGKPMPPGLELHNEMNGETTHVGSAGLVYVENVKPGKLTMRASGNFGSCEAHVQIPQHIMNVPDLGKIACE
jgi:outer membrane usher protein